eukprot:TRINITY_DN3442_c0_g3_i2.p1 TRINITY_DN3442_c0_g3~~TRINITY_DN3442_c0_g3_i2.p1  ORF type:complete len:334 (+),score=99.74 TRINITY_DN3442_c0_g3_i2:37-1038(+)
MSDKVWDEKVQSYHAGQGWKFLNNFKADFGVTCNCLGTPLKALEAARASVELMEHYPAADFEPALSSLSHWLSPSGDLKERFTLGNGASEIIDIVTRLSPKGPFKPGPSVIDNISVQYMEYQRSAEADGRSVIPYDSNEKEGISAIINPCNPTGVFLEKESLKEHISKKHSENSFVLVDESMLPWYGENWREQSLIGEKQWIENLLTEKGISVWIIHSWTKIWCCPGIRLGSVVAPTKQHMVEFKKKQVPWSLNNVALAFANEVVKDHSYMVKTWEVTKQWRQETIQRIATHLPTWKCYGQSWLSWIWIDTGDAMVAKKAEELALAGMKRFIY